MENIRRVQTHGGYMDISYYMDPSGDYFEFHIQQFQYRKKMRKQTGSVAFFMDRDQFETRCLHCNDLAGFICSLMAIDEEIRERLECIDAEKAQQKKQTKKKSRNGEK